MPERIAGFFAGEARGWVVSFRIGSGVWGSGLYVIVKPLPAITVVARGISRAKLVCICVLSLPVRLVKQ
eukprot:936894-Pelagomonas_calceolata.AAC.1